MLNHTEKILAGIWKEVLYLSEEEYQNLNRDSSFNALLPDWCATFELARLSKKIRDKIGIDGDELRSEIISLDTLGEQAALIESFLVTSGGE